MGGWSLSWCLIRRDRTCGEDARFIWIRSVVQGRGHGLERDVIRVEGMIIAGPSDHEWDSSVETNVLVLITSVVDVDFLASVCADES